MLLNIYRSRNLGAFYQKLDLGHFDYELYFMDGIKGVFLRGPQIDRSLPYIVCIGAAQTFGRFSMRPFPRTLAEKLSIQVVNFGVGGAGPAFFLKEAILELIKGAQLVIIQVLSGRSASCSVFDNSETGTLLGVDPTTQKHILYDQIVTQLIADGEIDQLKKLTREMQENYVKTMVDLLNKISAPKLLFWFSRREPSFIPSYSTTYGVLGDYPHLIDESTLRRFSGYADAIVKVVSRKGLPQKLWKANTPILGTRIFDGFLNNLYYPSQEMHDEAAEKLFFICKHLLQNRVNS